MAQIDRIALGSASEALVAPQRAMQRHGRALAGVRLGDREGGLLVGLVISNGVFPPQDRMSPGFTTLESAGRDAADTAAALRRRARARDAVVVHENLPASLMRKHIRHAAAQLEANATLFIVLSSHGASCAHGLHFVAGTDWRGPDLCDRGAVPLRFVLAVVADNIQCKKLHNVTLVVAVNTCRETERCGHTDAVRDAEAAPKVFGVFTQFNTQVITAYSCQPGGCQPFAALVRSTNF